ncbi:MAG: DUF805 domain-containing protein [Oligoflexus sp.]
MVITKILIFNAIILFAISNIRLNSKRFHDLDKSGWQSLLLLIPIVSLYVGWQLFFKKGDDQDNRWGPVETTAERSGAKRTGLLTLFIAVVSVVPATIFNNTDFMKNSSFDKRIQAAIADGQELDSTKFLSETEKTLAKAVEDQQCDADLNYQLAEAYIDQENFDRIEALYRTYRKQCGEFLELRWLAFHAAKKEGDFIQAERLAGELIGDYPRDKDYWVWRGLLYENFDRYQQAAEDYETAIKLVPGLESIPLNLVDMYKKSGETCKAFQALMQYLKRYPDLEKDRSLITQRRKLGRACRKARIKTATPHKQLHFSAWLLKYFCAFSIAPGRSNPRAFAVAKASSLLMP